MSAIILQPEKTAFISNRRAHKVHVIGPHLLDCSLPYDLWNHEAELAALVYLHMQRPDLDVESAYPDIVRAYLRSNRAVGIATRRFHATRTSFQVRAVGYFVDAADQGAYPAGVFAELLASPLAMPDFIYNFYSQGQLSRRSACTLVLDPDRLPLNPRTLVSFCLSRDDRHLRLDAEGWLPACA